MTKSSCVFSMLLVVGWAGIGCEPEVGSPCDDNEAEVDELVPRQAGSHNLVQSVGFDNCIQHALCLSANGGRPFCTKKCEADSQCADAGEGFTCSDDVRFGPNACDDYEDPALRRPESSAPSGDSCATDQDCATSGEGCFQAGEFIHTCGFVGRDCATGLDGGRSPEPFKYCSASPDDIAARDIQYGRQP